MNTITGYIEIPFHGEKGESAYEIAVKYGYEGTEEEWLDSLGFIPDKSISEEKLSDAMIGKLKAYEAFIGTVFDEKTEYEEIMVNDYSQEDEYTIPYRLIGVAGTYKVKIPKIQATVNCFDESDADLWSTEMGDYRFSKIDVSEYTGKNVKIYGVANTTPTYPCAFCTDENYNIIERYGMDKNTIYGYYIEEGAETSYNSTEAIEAVIPENAKYMYISGRRLVSGNVVIGDALPKLEVVTVKGYRVNDNFGLMQSPLWEKKLYVDGDSICYGNGYAGGFGKIIADKYNMTLINNAVGGATISNMGATDTVKYGTEFDWENKTYYIKITAFNVSENKSAEGFAYPITKEQYENGFGVYPTAYKLIDNVLTELEYSEEMPDGTFFVKFDVPTYGENTVEKYYRMWGTNSWLWEAYKSGFAEVHQEGKVTIATARHWLSTDVENVDETADYVIFEGGINDYLMNRPLGELTENMTDAVDTTMVVGALEHICRRLLDKCAGKKIMYVITPKAKTYAYLENSNAVGNKTLTDYHDAIVSVLEKYSIPCVDLFKKSMLNTELNKYLAYTKDNDGVHPTKEGYELFYVPQIVSLAERI